MNKTSMTAVIRTLHNWHSKGSLRFDMPIQRAEGQWNNLQQSLLIHSILTNFPIPPLYLLKEKCGDENVYSVLDGLQRLSTIFAFIDNEYPLHGSTPPVVVEDVDYDLENLYFNDLSEECQDAILGARLSTFCVEDCTPEEIEELFSRLNSSTPLTTIQKTRTTIGSDLATWAKYMNQMPFFSQSVNLSPNQARREATFETLLQSMLLLDARSEGYDYKSISMGDVKKYCESIRGNFTQDKRDGIEAVFKYLGDAFPVRCKWLKKSNVPTAAVIAQIAMEQGIEPKEFKRFIDAFSNMCCEEFEENTGSGNIRRTKTEGRIRAVYNVFLQYFKLDADTVASPFYEENLNIEEEELEEQEDFEGYDAGDSVDEAEAGETENSAPDDQAEEGESFESEVSADSEEDTSAVSDDENSEVNSDDSSRLVEAEPTSEKSEDDSEDEED